uniref:HMA domain-containing protein n=1 Tax=Heterorhabditis bacteriophora TaxID=37862 RepID=A0A1I7X187_HETBA
MYKYYKIMVTVKVNWSDLRLRSRYYSSISLIILACIPKWFFLPFTFSSPKKGILRLMLSLTGIECGSCTQRTSTIVVIAKSGFRENGKFKKSGFRNLEKNGIGKISITNGLLVNKIKSFGLLFYTKSSLKLVILNQ